MPTELPFDPSPFFNNTHLQTIFGCCLQLCLPPSSKTTYVALPDRDVLAMEISTPKSWKSTDPTVVMVHGLCGSHRSSNLVRMAKKLTQKGVRAVRVNLRGCGSGKGLSRHIYHGGQSADVLESLKVLKGQFPSSPITLIGFSLGGNIVLRLAGELLSDASKYFQKVIAVNPPVDLYSSILLLDHPDNAIYQRYFLKNMKDDVLYRHRKFPDLPKFEWPKNLTCLEFDRIYSAPHFGFSNVLDYYDKSSCKYLIPLIRIPAKILWSKDDPIIRRQTFEGWDLPENIQVFVTQKGGHMGYLGRTGKYKKFYWLDYLLLDWIEENPEHSESV
jgi:hypothetical protein